MSATGRKQTLTGRAPLPLGGMCNRYRMTAKQAELAARSGVASPYPEAVTFPPPELFPKRLG
jgi:hypothetical protein